MSLLEFEKDQFLDAFHDDGLLISAKGLGLERIFVNFLKVYSDAANLVLVLNTSSLEEEYYLEKLEKDSVSPLPKVINNEYNASDRQALYLQGGVLFITSRILVVDLLTDRVPVDKITGILVNRAHNYKTRIYMGWFKLVNSNCAGLIVRPRTRHISNMVKSENRGMLNSCIKSGGMDCVSERPSMVHKSGAQMTKDDSDNDDYRC